ncbi:MAG: hypothetical protein HYX92_10850 [Chloroflexi bacterium]|nr:hypothetical protein [Chloroflexota bacterium]
MTDEIATPGPNVNEVLAGKPTFINLFHVATSKSDVFATVGCTVPDIGVGDHPSETQVYYSRYVMTRDGAEQFAKLLVKMLWGKDVATELGPHVK